MGRSDLPCRDGLDCEGKPSGLRLWPERSDSWMERLVPVAKFVEVLTSSNIQLPGHAASNNHSKVEKQERIEKTT